MPVNPLAGFQYRGEDGNSASCLEAVWELLQTRQPISGVQILTCQGFHGLLIRVETGARIAIKSGFASGYGGEGPRTFATVLQLLRGHKIEIEERIVTSAIMERLARSALTEKDIDKIAATNIVRGMRWLDYIDAYKLLDVPTSSLWARFEPVIPLAVVDERLADLALRFYEDPGETVFKGFRRLEQCVADRLGTKDIGAKLFNKAFEGPDSFLRWPSVHGGVANGRLLLFKGAYAVYRNPRAHAEFRDDPAEATRAFVLLNELFALERAAVKRASHE